MKKLVCCFAIFLMNPGFSQSPFFPASTLKNRLSGKEQAQKKQAALVGLKDSTYYNNWNINASQWGAPGRVLYGYNAADKENSFIHDYIVNGAWQNNSRNVNYSFDANTNLLGYDMQYWSSSWVNTQHYTYTYDNANNRLTELTQSWVAATNSWRNSVLVTNTYDASHNRLTSIEQHWDLNTSSWINIKRETATYNTNNEYTSDVFEGWSTVNSSWENFERYLFFYTNGDPTGLVEEIYDSNTSTYMAIYKVAYTYDSNHHVLTSTSQRPNPNTMTWENADRETYTYDSYGNQITYLIEGWKSGTGIWENVSLQRDYYSYKTVGLDKATAQAENISLYPNPAADNIHILNKAGLKFISLSVMDVNGKQVLTQTLDTASAVTISLSALPQGMYMLELKSESGPVYKKFMKN